jgi:hypothetical protein
MYNYKKLYIYLCNVFAIAILSYSARIFIDYKYLFFIITIVVYGYFSFRMVKEIEKEFEKHENKYLSLFQYLLVVLPLPIVLSVIFQ